MAKNHRRGDSPKKRKWCVLILNNHKYSKLSTSGNWVFAEIKLWTLCLNALMWVNISLSSSLMDPRDLKECLTIFWSWFLNTSLATSSWILTLNALLTVRTLDISLNASLTCWMTASTSLTCLIVFLLMLATTSCFMEAPRTYSNMSPHSKGASGSSWEVFYYRLNS